VNTVKKWLSLTITLGTGSFPYSWILSKKLSYVGKYLSSCVKVSTKDTVGGTMTIATNWPDPPQGPPHFSTD
jgi:hypothetical protein